MSSARLDGGGYVLASESCAFSTIGARLEREIEPGEIVHLDADGYEIIQGAPPEQRAFCTFEQIYFARPDSVFEGELVHQMRQRMGRQLAKESPTDADIVVPVPDSGTPHAIGYALESGIPYSEGLIKSRYIGRTFIQPTDQLRKVGVAMKFNPLPQNLAGKRVVLVDDSIVRGNTSGPLVQMLREAGATEVHLRVACPPIKYPLLYGGGHGFPKGADRGAKDHPRNRRPCGRGLPGLHQPGRDDDRPGRADDRAGPASGYCNACFTGEYPFVTPIPMIELEAKHKFAGVWGD